MAEFSSINYIDWSIAIGRAARGCASAGFRVSQAGAGTLRGRRHPFSHPRELDLPFPRRKTLPIRLR